VHEFCGRPAVWTARRARRGEHLGEVDVTGPTIGPKRDRARNQPQPIWLISTSIASPATVTVGSVTDAKVVWPNATTYLGPHSGIDRVILRHNVISTPRHRRLPIRPITPPEESHYHSAPPQ
jgi:hypothetical protein